MIANTTAEGGVDEGGEGIRKWIDCLLGEDEKHVRQGAHPDKWLLNLSRMESVSVHSCFNMHGIKVY